MLILNYSKSGLKRRECWFCDDKKYKRRFTRFFQSNLAPKTSILFGKKETLIIDLNDWTFSSIHKKTRYDIRRIQDLDSIKNINKWSQLTKNERAIIYKSYNDFAKDKNVTLINQERVEAAQHNIFYSFIQMDSSFSYHIYIHDDKRVRLLYSWTLFDKESSIIFAGLNKLHTGLDINYAKELNFKMYDFGGFSKSRMNGIDRFKSRFGGSSSVEFNYFSLL